MEKSKWIFKVFVWIITLKDLINKRWEKYKCKELFFMIWITSKKFKANFLNWANIKCYNIYKVEKKLYLYMKEDIAKKNLCKPI